ncbi:hypothetical protein BSKO_08578 [Bryopsis sp. KO-2023]|nr:hypothetical protein BSKO_08578 [Bryopsis sp. KO-2023]
MILPATSLYGGTLGLVYFLMTVYVAQYRLAHNILIGDGGNKKLLQIVRGHGNFMEYTPTVLVLLMLAEFQGSHRGLVYLLGGMFTVGRLLYAVHSFFQGSRVFRVLGMLSTVAPMLLLGLVLVKDGLAGYPPTVLLGNDV